MSAPTALSNNASLRGMVLGVAAFSLFAVHDALVKGVIHDLPVVQILFVRSVVVTLICLAIGRAGMVRGLARSTNKPMLILRGVLTLAAWCMFYPAGKDLQLAEMTTLYYVAPVITVILAVVFLKERLTLARVGASAIGFFGVVVAMNPAGITIGIPALMALGAAFLWAVAMIVMRTVSKTESSLVLVFSMNLFYVVVLAGFALPSWVPMDARAITCVVLTGILGLVAQYALIDAARLVPASVLGTVEYSALCWSFIFGFLLYAEQPAPLVYVGAAMVVAAGLILAFNERRRRLPPPVGTA
ncbi:MAG: DMT family transporter [Devosia sp.]|nr:DMT family transporter [Devosia sp.]